MAYIKEYWNDKEKRAEQAKRHTKMMEEQYGNEINKSVRDTVYYFPEFECNKGIPKRPTGIAIDDIDSVSAVFKYSETGSKLAVLNFSSYKNPGGMFLNGSKAQEECLCHGSFLYNVLSRKQDFYEWNNKHKNRALYMNRALYSPNIMFFKNGESVSCDVITCAAPNKSTAQKYQNISDEENTEVLRSRIKFVLDIAKDNDVDTLILGAYGCGVFGQEAKEVAGIFKEYLCTTHARCFEKVVFAIPSGRIGNLEAFKAVWENQYRVF